MARFPRGCPPPKMPMQTCDFKLHRHIVRIFSEFIDFVRFWGDVLSIGGNDD